MIDHILLFVLPLMLIIFIVIHAVDNAEKAYEDLITKSKEEREREADAILENIDW